MFSKSYSAGLDGINSYIVNVEADVTDGFPEFYMVGDLPAKIKESRNRIRTAINNSGFKMQMKKVTINLSPANLRKEGTGYDLPIAVAVLSCMGYIMQQKLEDTIIIGELSLNGSIVRVNGILPMVYNAKKKGYKRCIVPFDNGKEAGAVRGIKVYCGQNLREVVDFINGNLDLQQVNTDCLPLFDRTPENMEDFRDVNGQEFVKRAVEVAVSGNHNMLMIGPPGAGKSMIAKRIPGIMPKLTFDESMDISKIYSISGFLDNDNSIIYKRPFRAPHHSITQVALTGGGRIPVPGEISLASGGVLFLDELPEFDKKLIEILRQPLEDRYIIISRLNANTRYPADFMLVAAMNPCNCGYYPDRTRCKCNITDINRYLSKVSRPILERIDICVEAARIDYNSLNNKIKGESSENIRERIEKTRSIQKKRFENDGILYNSSMNTKHIEKYCVLDEKCRKLIADAFDNNNMSARMYHKVLIVARTIADMAYKENIEEDDLMEALLYRNAIKKFWDNEI
ncbi:MAG: YifB family Mg chelatase-like AAA ATPase [Lachnospiraceae bacterium]|nr:YifB family Mg chelatase-like AAA ATPase [Lachnospiraceae bacterium]